MNVAIAGKDKPSWLVRGPNWVYEVESDNDDLDDTLQDQAVEAATKAVEIFKGKIPRNDRFVLDDEKEEPLMGIYLEVFLRNSPKDIGFPIFSFLCLANGGFYKDAWITLLATVEELFDVKDKLDKANIPEEVKELFKKNKKAKRKKK